MQGRADDAGVNGVARPGAHLREHKLARVCGRVRGDRRCRERLLEPSPYLSIKPPLGQWPCVVAGHVTRRRRREVKRRIAESVHGSEKVGVVNEIDVRAVVHAARDPRAPVIGDIVANVDHRVVVGELALPVRPHVAGHPPRTPAVGRHAVVQRDPVPARADQEGARVGAVPLHETPLKSDVAHHAPGGQTLVAEPRDGAVIHEDVLAAARGDGDAVGRIPVEVAVIAQSQVAQDDMTNPVQEVNIPANGDAGRRRAASVNGDMGPGVLRPWAVVLLHGCPARFVLLQLEPQILLPSADDERVPFQFNHARHLELDDPRAFRVNGRAQTAGAGCVQVRHPDNLAAGAAFGARAEPFGAWEGGGGLPFGPCRDAESQPHHKSKTESSVLYAAQHLTSLRFGLCQPVRRRRPALPSQHQLTWLAASPRSAMGRRPAGSA